MNLTDGTESVYDLDAEVTTDDAGVLAITAGDTRVVYSPAAWLSVRKGQTARMPEGEVPDK